MKALQSLKLSMEIMINQLIMEVLIDILTQVVSTHVPYACRISLSTVKNKIMELTSMTLKETVQILQF